MNFSGCKNNFLLDMIKKKIKKNQKKYHYFCCRLKFLLFLQSVSKTIYYKLIYFYGVQI